MPKVVYILGYGRSGSTVLNALLGQQSGVRSVGELVNLPRDGWLSNHFCSCGKRARDCEFWEAVRGCWQANSPTKDVERYIQLQQKYSGLLTGVRAPLGLFNSPSGTEYLATTQALYDSICAASGDETIVDSSKSPSWMTGVSKLSGVDLRIIHLVRDGRGTIVSLAKGYAKSEEQGIQNEIAARSALRTSIAWSLTNALSELVPALNGLRVLRLRYEELVKQPLEVLKEIEDFAAVDLSDVREIVATSAKFSSGCAIAGNRNRMNKQIQLTEDRQWHVSLSWRDAVTFWAVCAPMAVRYGYRPLKHGKLN